MARPKTNPPSPPADGPPPHLYYTPLPPQPDDENYTVLPYYHPAANPRPNWLIICTIVILFLAALAYILWPSDPDLKIQRFHLTHVQIHTKPVICIDISLNVTLKVHNLDVYSMDYKSLDVKVGYRGKKLGHVRSKHGHVKALGSSYVDAVLELECVKVLSDLVFLLEDLARGSVPFDTVTQVTGRLGLFFLTFPLEAKVFCEILVNTNSQTIARQNCYPKINGAELKGCGGFPEHIWASLVHQITVLQVYKGSGRLEFEHVL
ncbi:Late embryogenesis abundant protein [Melia azedarach]|uniref:Late embryogenesis abundant protein n=1 Tax=Melia azedarach TaxID=155640 RepID=A0ACC1Y356_MELAZ|nr:Late embryogenesis abundant protein [Melia azedarach]